MSLIYNIKDGDWVSVRQAINKLASIKLGPTSTPTFAGITVDSITLNDLTASRLVATDASKALASVADLTSWVAGTANEINIADDGDGSITLSTPQDIATTSSPTWVGTTWTGTIGGGSQESPIDLTLLGTHNGLEFHYAGNSYSVTGIRSRAQLITTDTTATAQGGLLQAANNDGINAGVLNGALIEAIGKSSTTAATISTMRACIVNAEWGAFDTVTTLNTLHVRTHSLNNVGAGSFGTGYGIYIENEAVGGNGQALDAGIYFKGTNLSGGNKAFNYGIDFTGADYTTANINLSANPIINANGTRIMEVNDTDYNFFLGSDAFDNDRGQYNVGLGYQAGYYNDTTGVGTEGDNNVYAGYRAGYGGTGGTTNTGRDNVGIAYAALYKNTSGYDNIAIGKQALYSNTEGFYNVGVGGHSLNTNTTGYYNLAFGKSSLRYNQIGGYNVSIGGLSGGYGSGGGSPWKCTYIGAASGYSITGGAGVVFIGHKSGYNQTNSSDLLIIDNQDRGSAALEATNSLLYGLFDATSVNQYLNLNGELRLLADDRKIVLGTGSDAEIYYNGTNLVLSPRVVGAGGVTIGVGAAGVDYKLIFDGETNDGTITWMEDEARFDFDSPIAITTIKSGATQAAAGAAANEIWKTNGHASLPDNVLMIGV